jgi:hypothetical protein
MFETTTRDEWIYRRDSRIRRRLRDMGSERAGTPVLAPDIALLYKAKHMRPHDTEDFYNAVPRLDTTELVWLRNAVRTAHPECHWFG